MIRFNTDHLFDTNPQDAVIGTTAPTAARLYTRGGWSTQLNHTAILSPNLLNELRFGFTDDDPVTEWGAIQSGTIYQRTAGAVPFKVGANQVSDLYSKQGTLADTLTWTHGEHNIRFGGSLARHDTGGVGTEPGQALLGTFTFNGTGPDATLPFDQLTLADVQSYSQPFSFGAPQAYTLNQWLGAAFVQDSYRVRSDLTLDLGLRYDRQSLTQSTKDFAPRIGFGWHPDGNSKLAIRGGYGMYYTQIQSNVIAGYLQSGLNGFTTYTASPGQVGFPTCLTGACLPVTFSSNPALAPARNITIIAGKAAFYTQQFAQFGLNFSKLPNYPDQLLSPRAQDATIGIEKEFGKGLFVSADYVYQYWGNLVRTVDLNAPAPFDRTAPDQCRGPNGTAVPCESESSATIVALADATRPITPVTGGVKQINTIMNLGYAYYNGLQTQVSYRGSAKWFASVSYTLSKAMNTSEPDGNGINPNQPNIVDQGNQELGPSLLDQRHRAVITFTYQLPYNITAGTVTQIASGRPINAITGVDNDGDGSASDDRPVINGAVVGKSAFYGTATQDVSMFLEGRIKHGSHTIVLRLEGFNLFNHANLIGRGITTYGNGATAASTFGQFTTVPAGTTVAIPAFANIDPPRMAQLSVRFQF
jgi:outer membrane receptor protein involved in Fe transport